MEKAIVKRKFFHNTALVICIVILTACETTSLRAGSADREGVDRGGGVDSSAATAVLKQASKETPRRIVVEIPKPIALPGQLMPAAGSGAIDGISESAKKKRIEGAQAVIQANKKALQTPNLEGYFNAMMVFDYMEGALYKVYTAPQRITDIAFEPGETLEEVAAGDTVHWQVITATSGKGNGVRQHLLIKPKETGLTNSLVVTTDRRTYHLLLVSLKTSYMASASWSYPQTLLNALKKSLEKADADAGSTALPLIDPQALNFNYEIRLVDGRKPRWMPELVFDDGKKSYIRLPQEVKHREAPVLFLNNEEGARIVNYRVKGSYYIIDRLFDRAELRSGSNNSTVVEITRS